MKQRIRFDKNMKDGILTVLESSEVDPGVVMPLHEEDYSLEAMKTASAESLDAFTRLIRRRTFFPTSGLCEKMYEQTLAFFTSDDMESVTIEYDDVESFPGDVDFELEDEDVELDEILEVDGATDEDEIKEIDDEDDTPRFTPEDTSEHEN